MGIHNVGIIFARNDDMSKKLDAQKIQRRLQLLRGIKIGGGWNGKTGGMIMCQNNHGGLLLDSDFRQFAHGNFAGIYAAFMNFDTINHLKFVVQQ